MTDTVKGEVLQSTHLQGPSGLLEVKVKEQAVFLNPAVFSDARTQRLQKYMIEETEKELGQQPYEVLAITRYPSGQTLLKIKGKNGESEINASYFTKA